MRSSCSAAASQFVGERLCGQREHRGAGAGDRGGESRPRAVRSSTRSSTASAGARWAWCSRSSVAAISRSGRSVRATTASAARLTLNAASRCGTKRRQQSAGVRGRRAFRRNECDGPDVGMHVSAPPSRPPLVRSRCPAHSTTRLRHRGRSPTHCRGALRTRRPAGPAASSVETQLGRRALRARPLAAASPPTAADADDPSPRECGITLRHTTSRPPAQTPAASRPRSMARTTRCDGPHGTSVGAFPFDRIVRPESGCGHHDLVVEPEREAEAVEARPRGSHSKPGPGRSPRSRRAAFASCLIPISGMAGGQLRPSSSADATATGSTPNGLDVRHAAQRGVRDP